MVVPKFFLTNMTRIVNFHLYECGICNQINLRPEYGSISTYLPDQLVLNANSEKKCKCCNKTSKLIDYKYVGKIEKKIKTRVRTLFFFWKIKEVDARNLYPLFD